MRRACLFLMVVPLAACHTQGPTQPEPPKRDVEIAQQPVLRPFARAGYFMLMEPLVVRVREGRDSLVVPRGLVTDFASIPLRLRGIVSKLGPHLCPAIVHDYLYWEQTCTRAEADAIFREMMEEMGVSWLTRHFLYWSVRGFGGSPWERSAHRRETGIPWIVPPDARSINPSETWSSYREYLRTEAGHYFPAPGISPGFCSHLKAGEPKGEG